MTSDDQVFLDTLASLSSQLRQAISSTPEVINHGIDVASNGLRETLQSTSWLPDSLKPQPPPPRVYFFPSSGNANTISKIGQWIEKHAVILAAFAGFIGTGGALYIRRRRSYLRKRRARKSKTGAKCEVVVVAGSAGSPISRSIILDLERRGFIVYVTCESIPEEEDVKAEQKTDILPLHLDFANSLDVENTITQFRELLRTPQRVGPIVESHDLSFAGLISIPDVTFPTGPIETLAPDLWSHEVDTKLMHTIMTIQAFAPTLCEFQSRVLVLTPSIVSSLNCPFHTVESTMIGALEGFLSSLRGELATVGVKVCQLRLGNFDCSSIASPGALAHDPGREILLWRGAARAMYARNYLAAKEAFYGNELFESNRGRRVRGTPLRYLNNAVFDTLSRSRPWNVQRVGQGSSIYAVVGALTPDVLIRRRMGITSINPGIRDQGSSDSHQWERVEHDR